jgi:hypothetical protein
MSVPYGAWLGSVEQDSFWAPHELCTEIQTFLAEHEHLYSRQTGAEIGVVYSVESNFQRIARRDQFANNRLNVSRQETVPFWEVCESLADAMQPFDVVFFPDGQNRPDTLAEDDLRRYRTLILPDCHYLTEHQAGVLLAYLEGGGHLLMLGDLGVNLAEAVQGPVVEHDNIIRAAAEDRLDSALLDGGPQVRMDSDASIAVSPQLVDGGIALHVIRYDYDEAIDAVPDLPALTIDIRLPGSFGTASVHAPSGNPSVELSQRGEWQRLELRDVPLYCVVLES